jgi:hypothetical protein
MLRVLAVAAALFAPCAWPDFCPAVKNDPSIDAYCYRISSRYAVPLPASFFFQPMTVCDVLSFLDKADSLAAAGRLSAGEAFDGGQLRKRISADYGLVAWKAKKNDARITLRCELLDSNSMSLGTATAGYVRGIASPGLNASLGDVSFYSGIDVWTDYQFDSMYRKSTYQPYDGVAYNLYGRADSAHVRASDMLRGGLIWSRSPVRLEAGIDRLKQGPAMASPLTFSGNAPPETYFRGILNFGIMEYAQAVGQLKSDKDKPKYFYMHRVSAPLFSPRLTGGLTEVIINGSTTNEPKTDSTSANALRPSYYNQTRGWELAYLIPFIPYAFAEHYIGDKDNKALSFDLNWAFPDNFRWYGELFLDDFTAPWTLFSNDWGNKWAFDVGGQWFTSLLSKDCVVSLEYSRVEPWVYTHFYGGSHRYDNFDVCLGAPLGPNSDLLAFSCESRLTRRNTFGATLTNFRTNHTQRGGTITDVFQDPETVNPDSPKKVFLEKNGLETVTRCGVYWKFDQLGMFRINLKYEYDFTGTSIVQLYGGLYF